MRQAAVLMIAASLFGCASFENNPVLRDQTITGAVAFGTAEGFKYAIKDSKKRTAIANYVSVYAPALRTIIGNPTPDQLIVEIKKFLPPNILSQFPEIESVVIPLIGSMTAKFGTTGAVLNDIATGLEHGCLPYVTHS